MNASPMFPGHGCFIHLDDGGAALPHLQVCPVAFCGPAAKNVSTSAQKSFFLPTTSIKETSLCEINDDFLNHLFLIHRGFMFVKPSSERREAVMSTQPAGETVLHIFSRPVSLTENLHTHKVNHEVSNLWRIC